MLRVLHEDWVWSEMGAKEEMRLVSKHAFVDIRARCNVFIRYRVSWTAHTVSFHSCAVHHFLIMGRMSFEEGFEKQF